MVLFNGEMCVVVEIFVMLLLMIRKLIKRFFLIDLLWVLVFEIGF